MLRYPLLFIALLLGLSIAAVAAPPPATPRPAAFGVAAHDNVTIEWWYVNAHVTTEKGRHLALIGSFFRFGSGVSPLDGVTPMPRAHYLIYAVTDLDRKVQRPYSLADRTMVSLLPLLVATQPQTRETKAFLATLKEGKLPPPHQVIAGQPSVVSAPFQLTYGAGDTLAATNGTNTAFDLDLTGGSPDKIHLTLMSEKPAMAVGGRGETGLTRPTDMYYYSLTRCTVGGTVDTGAGPEKITGGAGWFDHQWGNSWVAQNDGWDWWGVQLDDGTDVLVFRQRNLSTGKTFFPLATFMDKDGHQSVTKEIVFAPDPKSVWKSAKSGVRYPLAWTVTFPEKGLQLHISAAVQNQEMPVLGPGGGIWEGACRVNGMYARYDAQGRQQETFAVRPIAGAAYMELVGYNSPAVRAQIATGQ